MFENSSSVEYSSLESVVDLEWEVVLLLPVDIFGDEFPDPFLLEPFSLGGRGLMVLGDERKGDLGGSAKS